MSKAILLSIKPKWVAKILNGQKTIEIRKTMPKCDLPIDVYIYCTKDNKQGLVWDNQGKGLVNSSLFPYCKDCPERHRLVNGKVVAKFTVRKVEEIYVGFGVKYQDGKIGITYDKFDYSLLKKACLTEDDLINYLKPRIYDEYDYYDTDFFAYHIEDLVIFDEPKELSGFTRDKGVYYENTTKAPQNFCYVESEE